MHKGYYSEYKVFLAVDCIIFGFDDEDLKVLLIRRDFEPEKGKWSLMGGFLKKEETLDDAASRVLFKLTGMHNIYMEQLYSFSEVDRDPVDRTISTSYYAIVNIEKHNKELIQNYNAKWFSLSKVPDLIFDHNIILKKAVRRLRRRTSINPIGFELLPEKFTMRQLQKLYEAILDKKLDKRNFINKINSMDILVKLKEKDMSSSTKGSFLYQFDQQKYDAKQEKNFYLKI
ncbi:DNA mismatch repair protein MutT [Polaribacter reichenbachii]|uniref:DNA mismatch repair protein MutT n=1 Tax=Polaribacter reichenbachii TaxID=996801 RepID=A0A1B8U642_9FLAO|nr:NUDIX domain-containing protein [Polaribacter reichenbachii]APZ45939.1 DNA mismatch repair protein MutT [Polaribacter reichenbachii]AUC19801.1 DNA mismatch repair protein MutT [Polaribacter reichenbachii]OBY67344.1 DNA mismatch repair protein MutT [Polaribacter reichenbachii]